MIQRVYIDTSVIGGCFDSEFSKWSNKLVEEIISGYNIAVISDVTIDEIEKAPLQIRDKLDEIIRSNCELISSDPEIENLAEKYILQGAVTIKFYEDALHIALATVYKVDVLASWNFKHIVNLDKIRSYNSVNLKYGYSILEVRSPREIIKE